MTNGAKRRGTLTLGALVFSGLFGPPAKPAHAKPRLRTDLQQSLGTVLCNMSGAPSPQTLWQAGVFDSDLHAQQLTPQAKQTAPTEESLQRLALSFARRNHHLGYSYGVCGPKRAWLLSVPAPQPLTRKDAT